MKLMNAYVELSNKVIFDNNDLVGKEDNQSLLNNILSLNDSLLVRTALTSQNRFADMSRGIKKY